MGLSSKKQTTDTHETTAQNTASTAATQVNVPQWLLDPAQKVAGGIGQVLGQGPDAYAPQTSGLQQAAFAGAKGLLGGMTPGGAAPGGAAPGDMVETRGTHDPAAPTPMADAVHNFTSQIAVTQGGGAQGAPTPQPGPQPAAQPSSYDAARQALDGGGNVSAGSVLDGLDKYYNPFKDQVLNPVLNDYDQQAGITRAAQAAQGAQGAFRGSRFGIREGQTEGELARGRAATEGGLLGNMYTQATGLSAADQDRGLQAALANQGAGLQRAGLLTNLGSAQNSDTRADMLARGSENRSNLSLANQLGQTQTDQANTQRQYPLSFLHDTSGLLAGLNPSDYFGRTIDSTGTNSGVSDSSSTSKQTDSGLAQLGQAAQIAALFI